MSYLLDTDICVYLLNESDDTLAERLRNTERAELHVASITAAELLYGAARSGRPTANKRRVTTFLRPLTQLPFDHACAVVYAPMRARLAATGKPIGPMDMLIASTAIAHKLTLVTNNEREFRRVTKLRVDNWMA